MAEDRPHGADTSLGASALRRVGGTAAFVVAAILVVGAIGLAVPASGPGLRNWLVVLFQLNGGMGSVSFDVLRVLNPIDIAILVGVGLAYLGLWPGPVRPHRLWMVIAVALPFAGIVVFLLTGLAGRSSVMMTGIIVAILFAVDRRWLLAVLGIVANSALLVADFATGGRSFPAVAVAVAVGYLLLVGWFAVLGSRMLRRR